MSVIWPHPDDLLREVLEWCERCGFHVRDSGALASALERPTTAVFGEEQYPDLLTKAAVLLDAISRSHPLLDGNKRLAWTFANVICKINGVSLIASPTEIDQFVRQIAGAHHELTDIASWLEAHAQS